MDKVILKIKNNFFDPETIFNLNEGKAISLIYGTNGSGKTTITRAISYLKDPNFEFDGEASFLDKNHKPINLDDEKLNNIFVFNELFIDKNIKEKSSGLKSIIILGDNIEIDNKIDNLLKEIDDLNKQIVNINIEKYDTPKNPNYIKGIQNEIIKNLRENYAERGKSIEARSNKLPVTESTITDLSKYKNSKNVNDSIKKFNSDLNLLNKTRGKGTKLEDLKIKLFGKPDNEIINLLIFHEDVKIKESLKRRFDEYTSKHGIEIYSHVKDDVETIEYCPLCLRPFDKESKNDLRLIVNEIFDQRAKEIENSINGLLLELQKIEIIQEYSPYFKEIDSGTITLLNNSITEYNNVVEHYQTLLRKKLKNIKGNLTFDFLSLDDTKKSLNENMARFNLAFHDFNSAVDSFDTNKNNLKKLNCEIAYREIETQLNMLNKLVNNRKQDEIKIQKIKNIISNKENEIAILKSQKLNTNFAIENINTNLRLIYNNTSRLKLVPSKKDEFEYNVLCRGKSIKPNKLSAGERNAIALCYFYETIKANRNLSAIPLDKNIIILDDPITSLEEIWMKFEKK